MRASFSFPSFMGGGFECATHRRWDGRRLDLIAGTGHGADPLGDYAALAQAGMLWARDGLRWHLIAARPGAFDWSSWLPLLEAAELAGVAVAWDLIHFGVPDRLDPWGPAFVPEAARLAAEAALLHRRETGRPGLFCPVNEISFWAYAGGERGWFAPWGRRRGIAFKRRIMAAAIAMARAVKAADPEALLLWAEPLMAVSPSHPGDAATAAALHASQYEAYDSLLGLAEPELGGGPELADWLGFNFYPHNQRRADGSPVPFGCPGYRGLSALLGEAQGRYPQHPFLLTETGAEGPARAAWLHHVTHELLDARDAGVPVAGACLYPVTDYPGWDNDRVCETGLFGLPGPGGRPLLAPVLAAVREAEARLGCPRRAFDAGGERLVEPPEPGLPAGIESAGLN